MDLSNESRPARSESSDSGSTLSKSFPHDFHALYDFYYTNYLPILTQQTAFDFLNDEAGLHAAKDSTFSRNAYLDAYLKPVEASLLHAVESTINADTVKQRFFDSLCTANDNWLALAEELSKNINGTLVGITLHQEELLFNLINYFKVFEEDHVGFARAENTYEASNQRLLQYFDLVIGMSFGCAQEQANFHEQFGTVADADKRLLWRTASDYLECLRDFYSLRIDVLGAAQATVPSPEAIELDKLLISRFEVLMIQQLGLEDATILARSPESETKFEAFCSQAIEFIREQITLEAATNVRACLMVEKGKGEQVNLATQTIHPYLAQFAIRRPRGN